jgi:hypothetical protein
MDVDPVVKLTRSQARRERRKRKELERSQQEASSLGSSPAKGVATNPADRKTTPGDPPAEKCLDDWSAAQQALRGVKTPDSGDARATEEAMEVTQDEDELLGDLLSTDTSEEI